MTQDDLVKKAYDLGIVRWDVAKELVELITKTEREACFYLVKNYMKETENMEARGCLASVAYDIKARGQA